MQLKLRSQAAAAAIALLASAASGLSPDTPVSNETAAPSSSIMSARPAPCFGLPRNTVLASCPSPCLDDAPCIVYDQNAEHTQLTGCDYPTANQQSFCTSQLTETCEIHCFPKYSSPKEFLFWVDFKAPSLGAPVGRAPQDPSLTATPVDDYPYQSNDFVASIGKLSVSKKITSVDISGGTDDGSGRIADVTVDPSLLANAPTVTSLSLANLPLDTEQVTAILASSPPKLKELTLPRTNLKTLPWKMFAPVPKLEVLYLNDNHISLIAGDDTSMPALRELYLVANKLSGFELRAPKLNTLGLEMNALVSIPQSVYTYPKLAYLNLSGNPLIQPLVVTAPQLAFLEGVAELIFELVDPPDQAIVSRLPISGGNYGSYSDGEDLSVLLQDGSQTFLHGDWSRPVTVVGSKEATKYNRLLDLRARNRVGPSGDSTPSPQPPVEPTPTPTPTSVSQGSCLHLPRNTVLSTCPAPCLADAPCIVYDQYVNHTKLTGCDYDTVDASSFCTSQPIQTCEFHCFAKFTDPKAFLFSVDFKASDLGEPIERAPADPNLIATPVDGYPYQSNDFVTAIGQLSLSKKITTVDIAGDFTDGGDQFVEVTVDPAILASAPSVTSLYLSNLPLGSDELAAIVASAPSKLKALGVERTNVDSIPWKMFASLKKLELLSLVDNQISLVSEDDTNMPALTELKLGLNTLSGFELRAPKLKKLSLEENYLVRIPQSVFTYTKLQTLTLSGNPIIRPLVLTKQQVQFLEALPEIAIELVDPPDAEIVSRLPVTGGNYGDYTDDVDLSEVVEGATEAFLRGDLSLPVRVVNSKKAATYNDVLELRARNRVEPSGDSTTEPTSAPTDPDMCFGLPRDTVLSSCPAPCLPDAPCVVYDQDAEHTTLTGCDYNTANPNSFCWSKPAQTCEIHCFPKNADPSTFAFWATYIVRDLGQPKLRTAQDPSLLEQAADSYQSNDFVFSVAKLNLSETISYVEIQGGADKPDQYNGFDVDPAFLADSPSVTALSLSNVRLFTSQVDAIVSSAPQLRKLELNRTDLEMLSWETFAQVPNLEHLSVVGNKIKRIAGNESTLSALTQLDLSGNQLDGFELHAPILARLNLSSNKIVRIPESVYTFTRLEFLDLLNNSVIRPLVLTAPQVKFLEALPNLDIELADPPDENILSVLPPRKGSPYKDYSDGMNLSTLLEGATETQLRGNPLLPVRLVASDKAALYNHLLEARARAREAPSVNVPKDVCQGVLRRMLLSNCAADYCPTNGACVAYDPDSVVAPFSGCNYTVASTPSFCTTVNTQAKTCEFQCFGAYQPQSQFKFFIPFTAALGEPVPREPYARYQDFDTVTTTEIPFLTNSLLDKIGALQLTSTVMEVLVAGGRSEKVADRFADVDVSSDLLSKAPAVTSLSLLNIDLSKSDVAAILASALMPLKLINLRHTNLKKLPAEALGDTQQLTTLILAQNGLTTFDTGTKALPKLSTLDLSDNALTTVNINAPNLKTLDLSGNKLADISPSVFDLKALQTLNLKNNAIEFPLVLTLEQVAFLTAVPEVTFDVSLGLSPTMPPGTPTGNLPSSVPESGAAGNSGAVVLPNGTAAVVKGVPVIIVSEPIAKEYNDKLEQKQKASTPTTRPRSNQGSTPRTTRAPSSNSLNATGLSNERSRSSGSGSASYSGSGGDLSSEDVGWTDVSDVSSGSTDSSSDANGSLKTTTPASKEDPVATAKASGMSLATKLVLGGVGSAFFVIVAVVLFVILKRRKRDPNQEANYVAMADPGDEATGPDVEVASGKIVPWWKDDAMQSYRLNAADISDVRVIGSGGSGITWLVNYRSGTRKLVSKRLVIGEGAVYEAKLLQLYSEAKLGSELRYPSVVPFVGVAWTNKTDFQVLYEYMSNGDLSAYLAKTDAVALPWLPKKLQMAIDIIEALVYAHSFNPPLLHRDLKTSNVLLDNDFKAKLGDFGCARPESDSNTMTTSEIGTGRWLAPEILLGSTSYGAPSDIYSFGVVLCELDTHKMPYAMEADDLSESALLQRVARGELRPMVSAECPPEIREMVEACLAFDPAMRPTAMQVSYKLRLLQRQSQNN